MQQRRYRPGDVLDDYCPRERRITDHAIVAMIDDHIKQTRCVVCDAEHEYKDGKVPPQRRKKPQAALFTQVLDGLTGPQPPARVPAPAAGDDGVDDGGDDASRSDAVPMVPPDALTAADALTATGETTGLAVVASGAAVVQESAALEREVDGNVAPPTREEGPWRRQLIRAALPRPEGQQPTQPTRPAPEFTIRQPNNARGHRHGRRRGGSGFAGQGGNGNHGPMRFGRSGQGQGQGQGSGQGQGGRRRRGRGGKKNN